MCMKLESGYIVATMTGQGQELSSMVAREPMLPQLMVGRASEACCVDSQDSTDNRCKHSLLAIKAPGT